ncbi:hypothetical protein OG762_39965 [Streptomyces sp. NBC_01136]|uniref:hypothetical protein n=1 Tax=unclassified Streptomyces TaxID=2593676 RepID=UPI0032442CD8|nr:hypothetical protein OG762_39965 [Streptomyces sp. NBC_01136]
MRLAPAPSPREAAPQALRIGPLLGTHERTDTSSGEIGQEVCVSGATVPNQGGTTPRADATTAAPAGRTSPRPHGKAAPHSRRRHQRQHTVGRRGFNS